MCGTYNTRGRGEKCIQEWLENQRKKPLGRTRRMWKNNIKTELKEMLCKAAEWMHLPQGLI